MFSIFSMSETESSCIQDVTYVRRFFSVLIFDLDCLTLFLFPLFLQRVALWPILPHSLQVLFL